MQTNTLAIKINKPIHEVFAFCVTPPNSSRWIPGIVDEKTSEWPVRVGTVYRLQNKTGDWSEVAVEAIKRTNWLSFQKAHTIAHIPLKQLTGKQLSLLITNGWIAEHLNHLARRLWKS